MGGSIVGFGAVAGAQKYLPEIDQIGNTNQKISYDTQRLKFLQRWRCGGNWQRMRQKKINAMAQA